MNVLMICQNNMPIAAVYIPINKTDDDVFVSWYREKYGEKDLTDQEILTDRIVGYFYKKVPFEEVPL